MLRRRPWRFLFLVLLLSAPLPATALLPTQARRAMVVSATPQASAAGLEILRAGGNAADAAIATTLAISVSEPYAAGIGGGGFLLIQQGDRLEALDFRERAPAAATPTMYRQVDGQADPRASREGYRAIAIPGTLAGLQELHRRYGRLPWSRLVQPSIRLADQGIPVTPLLRLNLQQQQTLLSRYPASAAVFLPGGQIAPLGSVLRQPELARSLTELARQPESFYRGAIARAIVADQRRNGGLMTAADLAGYRPIWRQPLCGPFRQWQVCSMPPPSSGGVALLQSLALLEFSGFDRWPWHSPQALHRLASAQQIAFADRARWLGDPAFTPVPVRQLLDPGYLKARAAEIPAEQARTQDQVQPATATQLGWAEKTGAPNTSHLTVVDGDRTVISLTFTINTRFGSGVTVPGTGILLNNEMDDFSAAPDARNSFGLVGLSQANRPEGGKTPLSSMTPFILRENGQPRLAGGAPGGSTIISTVLQLILNHQVYGLDVGAAVAAARLHQQWVPDQLRLERFGFDPLTVNALVGYGYRIRETEPWGNGNLLAIAPDGGLSGAADPRGEGVALGLD